MCMLSYWTPSTEAREPILMYSEEILIDAFDNAEHEEQAVTPVSCETDLMRMVRHILVDNISYHEVWRRSNLYCEYPIIRDEHAIEINVADLDNKWSTILQDRYCRILPRPCPLWRDQMVMNEQEIK